MLEGMRRTHLPRIHRPLLASISDSNQEAIGMAQILVRGLDEQVKQAPVSRAAANGRSMEAEARAILTEAVESRNVALEVMERVQADDGLDGLVVPERTDDARWADIG
ncbi:FitA-like ribbon-helix-helix domain-containing protein [Micrococcus lylae]|nr:toxin-antitoxin system [Micrococcus lylae]